MAAIFVVSSLIDPIGDQHDVWYFSLIVNILCIFGISVNVPTLILKLSKLDALDCQLFVSSSLPGTPVSLIARLNRWLNVYLYIYIYICNHLYIHTAVCRQIILSGTGWACKAGRSVLRQEKALCCSASGWHSDTLAKALWRKKQSWTSFVLSLMVLVAPSFSPGIKGMQRWPEWETWSHV